MVRKHSLYQLSTVVWWLASVAAVFLVASGNAQPYVAPAVIPYGGPGAVGTAIGLVFGGTVIISRFEHRAWKEMGRAVGLGPEGRSLYGKSDLAGTVHGRTVRVFTYEVTKNSGGEGGSSSTTYTVVEAELRAPEQNGYIIGRGEAEEMNHDEIPPELRQKDIDGEYYLIGDVSADYGRQILTPRVRDALSGHDGPGAVVVGDPTQAIMAALPDEMGGLLGSVVTSGLESKLADKRSFKAAMASHNTRGLLLSADRLNAQIEAVVAVADAHEAASVEAPQA